MHLRDSFEVHHSYLNLCAKHEMCWTKLEYVWNRGGGPRRIARDLVLHTAASAVALLFSNVLGKNGYMINSVSAVGLHFILVQCPEARYIVLGPLLQLPTCNSQGLAA